MPSKPRGADRDRVLSLLNSLAPADTIENPQLNAALAPFRRHPPTALKCSKRGCGRTFLWVAVCPETARARFSSHGPRKGYVAKLNRSPERPPWLRAQPPPPYDYWSLGPHGGEDSGEPADNSEGPTLRWRFRCPKCDAPRLITNRRLIELIVAALVGGSKTATP